LVSALRLPYYRHSSENVIDDEPVDIVTNTPARVAVHLNDLLDGNIGAGTVDATENWWDVPAAAVRKNVRLSVNPEFFSRLG
jgi:hypothetical protein